MAGRFNLAERIQAAQPPRARDIETITGEILEAKRAGGEAILAIGKGLMEAKALLSHGEWLPWLEERVEFSEKVAQNFMRLARHYSNPKTLSDLGASKALILLALPDETREEYIEAPHIVDGEEKTVADMSTRELKAALKERDAALKAAEQARADQKAADEAREKLSQEMKLANERVSGLNDLVERYSAEAQERQAELARLSTELKELKERPVEVAVEVDAEAVEAARREAEAAMQAKLEEAQKAQAQAEKAQKSAEEARAEAQKELERIRSIQERAEKKPLLTADEDLILFRTLFDQVQEQVNKLGGVLMKVRGRELETAGNLQKALLALSEKIRGVAEQ